MPRTITIDHELSDEFLDGIIEIAVEGPIDYWVDFITPFTDGISLGIVGWKDEPEEVEVGIVEVADAIAKILAGSVQVGPSVVYDTYRAVTEGDLGHVDWDVADVVIQVAAMGEVVFG